MKDNSFDDSMTRLANGDNEVARMILERFTRRLLGLARRKLPASEDPEDILQSVYRSFFRRHESGQFEFTSWNSVWCLLAEITVRKCAGRMRYLNAERRQASRTIQGQVGELPWEPISNDPLPEHLAVLNELIEEMLNKLQPDQRQVAILTLQGFSAKEISESLGKGIRSVQLIRSTMKKCLQDWGSS